VTATVATKEPAIASTGERYLRGVDDGQEDEEPEEPVQVPRHAFPGGVTRAREAREPGRAERHFGGVRGEHVEDADAERGVQDCLLHCAARVAAFFGERGRALESAECEQREHRARDHAGKAAECLGRVAGAEDLDRVVAARVDDEEHREHDEDRDLEQAENRAHARRRLDAVVPGREDDGRLASYASTGYPQCTRKAGGLRKIRP
jgi:hypothetical protein